MHGNYDSVAPFYDRLSRLVFGEAIVLAQLFLLKAIPTGTDVLIIGGGTGWILEEIARKHQGGLKITYVEISREMMHQSRSRNAGENQVTYICQSIQEARLEHSYDVVITPFLFDNFSDNTLRSVFDKVDHHLKKNGLWLFADFQLQEGRILSKILLKAMYLFFGLFCRLETTKLPDSATLFRNYKYHPVCQEQFYDGFIYSIVYQKN